MSPLSRFQLAMVLLVVGLTPALAFPPAPDGMVYGLVKDQYGTPVLATNCQVILQTSAGVQEVGYIQPALAVGLNYSVKVPMDAGTLPNGATSQALTMGVSFKLYVVSGGITNLPIEMTGTWLQTGTPSFQLRQDLTQGTSTNGLGLPDQWLQQFFAEIGTNIPLASLSLNGVYTKDGRTLKQQYLLGNYPYDPTNTFSVTLVSQNAGSALLAFTAIQGRTYSVSGSTDLQNWAPLSFTVPVSGAAVSTVYPATTTIPVQIQTVQPTNAPTMQFFRLQVN